MGKTYIGVNGVAEQVKKAYIGVNGVAKEIKKAYVGVNDVARLIYSAEPERTYLWNSAYGDNTALTGGWSTGNFYHQTNGGTNYNMTRMSEGMWQGTHLLQGAYSSSDGSSEKAMFAMTAKAIDFTPYTKLVAVMTRNISRNANPSDAWLGVFNASSTLWGVTCKTSELGTKFLAHATHPNNVTSGAVGFTLTIDISGISGSYLFVYDNFSPNMNASINVNFSDLWLE